MKSKGKAPINTILLVMLVLSVLELMLFIVLKAEAARCVASAFSRFSVIFINRYSHILDIANDLSLAYIMSYIFYVVILIPERKKQKSINKYICIYLQNIVRLLDDIIRVSSDFVSSGGKKLISSPYSTSALRKDTGRVEFLTYREHFIKFFRKFSYEYQHLSHYIAFIDDELRDCLNAVITCEFITKIEDLLINAGTNEFDDVFEEHFDDTAIIRLNTQLKHLF